MASHVHFFVPFWMFQAITLLFFLHFVVPAKLLKTSDSHIAPRSVQQNNTLELKVAIGHNADIFLRKIFLLSTYLSRSREKIYHLGGKIDFVDIL